MYPSEAENLYTRLQAHGFKPSGEAGRLHDAMHADGPDVALAKANAALREAMLTGKGVQEAQAAVSSASNVREAWAEHESQRRTYAEALMPAIAAEAFAVASSVYNTAGAAFERALATVDPDAPAEVIMGASDDQRQSWAAIPALVAQVEEGVSLLAAVMRLCGRGYAGGTDAFLSHDLGLFVTMADAHPRRVAEAWAWKARTPSPVNPSLPSELDRLAGGRAGRWRAIIHYGAHLRCPFDEIGCFAPYPLKPLYLDRSRVLHDPHDSAAEMQAFIEREATERADTARTQARVDRIRGAH